MRKALLTVEDLKMHFPLSQGLFGSNSDVVKAVDGVSFSIYEGETFGLVGESGCGKTTTGKCILGVHKPTAGKILYKDVDLANGEKKVYAPFRREIQLIFQDPFSSLDPRQSVFSILKEALSAEKSNLSQASIQSRAEELLSTVELDPAMGYRYPHEMSGGQRQRLGIARALACNPTLIVCDEPVSALDVSIQAQIINLFRSIQQSMKLTYLFVAHDLAVVRHISDRVGVMYLGRLVELTKAETLYASPTHPYTKALLSAVPVTDYELEQNRRRILLQGEAPSPIAMPSGCSFHPRCAQKTGKCQSEIPPLRELRENHMVACHHV